ncbi:hypothetical protein D3C78_1024720 [compost metagenome]
MTPTAPQIRIFSSIYTYSTTRIITSNGVFLGIHKFATERLNKRRDHRTNCLIQYSCTLSGIIIVNIYNFSTSVPQPHLQDLSWHAKIRQLTSSCIAEPIRILHKNLTGRNRLNLRINRPSFPKKNSRHISTSYMEITPREPLSRVLNYTTPKISQPSRIKKRYDIFFMKSKRPTQRQFELFY